MSFPRQDMTGKRFSRLLVIRGAESRGKVIRWLCQCDCGNEITTDGTSLRLGRARSCGCLVRETSKKNALKHGHAANDTATSEYGSWYAMIKRCENPNSIGFANYGGRGISVCPKWRESFVAFLADMGLKPTRQHTIDRIDNDGNYEPGNCRWATRKQQNENQRPRKDRQPMKGE